MYTYEHKTHVEAPVEHVFDYVQTAENWLSTPENGVRNVERREERTDGYLLDLTYRIATIEFSRQVELTVEEPNKHLVSTIRGGGVNSRLEYYFLPNYGGTKVVQRATYELPGVYRALKPVVARHAANFFEKLHVDIRAELET